MARGYVGRVSESAEFDHALEALALGQGGLLLVIGDPGIGKTRFLEEAALRSREHGYGVAWATCWQGGEATSLSTWSQLIDQLGEQLPVEGEPTEDPEASRLRRHDLCVEQLRRLAGDRPLLLVVDDLPWADEGSLRLLRHAVGALHAMPVLVAASARAPLAEHLDELVRRGRSIPLVGLDRQETEALVRDAVGSSAGSEGIGILHEHTRGNPLFARELARLLAAEGRLDEPGTLIDAPLPDSVRGVVRERLVALSDASRDLLGVVAVAGEEARNDLLTEITGGDAAALAASVEEARAAGLAQHDPAGRVVLTHPLFRTVLYEGLGVARRVRLHEQVGRALLALRDGGGTVRPAVLADHFLRSASGGTVGEAVSHAREAAEEAIRLAAYEDAVALLERACAALDINPAAADRVELLLDLGHARSVAGDHPGARKAHLEAAALARAANRADGLARAALGLSGPSGFEVPLFDHDQVDLLEEALRELGEADHELWSWCAARLSVALSLTGVDARRGELAEEAVALARESGSSSAVAHALAARCDADAGPATCESRLADAGEIVEIGRRLGDRAMELLGRRHRVVALLELGDLVAADVEIDAFARVAAPLAQARFDWYVALWRAARALYERRLDDFERLRSTAEELGARSGSPNAEILTLAQSYLGLALTGRRSEAAAVFDEVLAGQGFAELGVQMAVSAAFNHMLADRLDQARIVLDAIQDQLQAAPHDSEWLPMLVQATEAAAAVGGHPVGDWAREQLTPYADRWVVEGIGAVIRGPVRQWLESVETPSENSWVREGDVWAVTFRGRTVRMRDSKGIRDLGRLLASPGRELAALDLMGAGVIEADTGAAIDETARRKYRERLEDIEAELDAADRAQDAGSSERLVAEREAILAELTAAYGLGGRSRRAGGSAERARTAVTARLRDTVKRIAAADPDLGRHLTRSVRTGTFCCYDPDPPESWTV
jgi:tetratricopeptide (TPR) repeat protein